MPNIDFGDVVKGRYIPLDLKTIDTSLVRMQDRFDAANEAIAKQMGDAQGKEFLDPIAREKALTEMSDNYKNLTQKYNGNLQNAFPEVARTIYTNIGNPWFNTNRVQLEEAKKERDAQLLWGGEAITLSNVANETLIDSNTGGIKSAQDPTLKANVVKAADYQQIANNLTHLMKPDQYSKLLKKYKGDPTITGFLTTGSFGGLSEKKILEIVNDPALAEVFKSMAHTYKFDNRDTVGYDSKTGTNMFTRELTDAKDKERFKSPIAKYLYGVAKQMKHEFNTNEYQQDPLAIHKAKRGYDEEQARKLFTPSHTEEKYNMMSQGFQGLYKPTWGKDGKMSNMNYTTKENYAFNPQRMLDDAKKGNILGSTSEATNAQQEIQKEIDNYRHQFNISRRTTDQAIYNKFLSKPMSFAYKGLEVQPDRAADMLRNFKSGAANLKVSVDGGEPLLLSKALETFGLGTTAEFFDPTNGLAIRSYTGLAPDPKTGRLSPKQATVSGSLIRGDKTYDISMVTDNIETQSRYIDSNLMVEAMRTAKPQRSASNYQGLPLIAVPYMNSKNEIKSVMLPIQYDNDNEVIQIAGKRVPVSEATRYLSASAAKYRADDMASLLQDGGEVAFSFDQIQDDANNNQFYAVELGGSAATRQQSLANKYFLENTDPNYYQSPTE